jgi:hypothetical protein
VSTLWPPPGGLGLKVGANISTFLGLTSILCVAIYLNISRIIKVVATCSESKVKAIVLCINSLRKAKRNSSIQYVLLVGPQKGRYSTVQCI